MKKNPRKVENLKEKSHKQNKKNKFTLNVILNDAIFVFT